ncbi:MAG: tetratricopeptide repeat protein [Candidatus Competibacteraceae bacterium]|nr:tetratricopeptide repeat protein [Candidatus Competibacteraceae bacterium]
MEPEIPPVLIELHKSAEAGNANAQLELGIRYATVNRVTTYELTALFWISQAAAQGYATAQYELGSYYTLESSRDDEKAIKWLRSAAEQGHAPAQFSLGALYVVGRGVPADPKTAYTWLCLVADQGDVEAMLVRTDIANRMAEPELSREICFLTVTGRKRPCSITGPQTVLRLWQPNYYYYWAAIRNYIPHLPS